MRSEFNDRGDKSNARLANKAYSECGVVSEVFPKIVLDIIAETERQTDRQTHRQRQTDTQTYIHIEFMF